MEPVASAVNAVYASAERYLRNRMQETEFSLDLITETAEFIGPCLDKFREEQKIEIIISTLNLLYKSAFVKAHLTTLADERRLKIERFMTEALPHYVAMLNDPVRPVPRQGCFSRLCRCLPRLSFNRSQVAAGVIEPVVQPLVVRKPEPSLIEESPPSETRQPEATYEKDAILA